MVERSGKEMIRGEIEVFMGNVGSMAGRVVVASW